MKQDSQHVTWLPRLENHPRIEQSRDEEDDSDRRGWKHHDVDIIEQQEPARHIIWQAVAHVAEAVAGSGFDWLLARLPDDLKAKFGERL